MKTSDVYAISTARIFVMSLACAVMFCACPGTVDHYNSLASNKESQAERVVKSLNLKPGDAVADIGCGSGYFTLLMARAVGPNGKVYAVDIDEEMVAHVAGIAKREKLVQIVTVKATPSDSSLRDRSVDVVFMRNVFHDLKDNANYFINLRSKFKEGGKIAIIDYRPRMMMRLTGHFVEENAIIALMNKAGYRLIERIPYLEEQSYIIFSPRANDTQ